MKKPQTNASPDRQEKPKARVPFFAQQLKSEALRTIQGGEDSAPRSNEAAAKG